MERDILSPGESLLTIEIDVGTRHPSSEVFQSCSDVSLKLCV